MVAPDDGGPHRAPRALRALARGRRVEAALEGPLRVAGRGRQHVALLGEAGPVWLDVREDAIGPRCLEVEALPDWGEGEVVHRRGARLALAARSSPSDALARDAVELGGAVVRAPGAFDVRWPSASDRARRAEALLEPWTRDAPGWGLLEGALTGALSGLVPTLPPAELAPAAVVDALVGLGPGLTPSGDDVAGGYLWASAVATGATLARGASVDVAGVAARTTPFGAARLGDHALGHGCPAERALVEALFAERLDPGRIEASLDALDRLGHSSGWDFALGLALALAPSAIEGALERRAARRGGAT